jgi:hypothetical protein
VTEASRRYRHLRGSVRISGPLPSDEIMTVASLGIRVRLVPADADRVQKLAGLRASCELLRADWDRLIHQFMEILDQEDEAYLSSDKPFPPSQM